MRATDVLSRVAGLHWIVLGYGITLVLAIIGAVIAARGAPGEPAPARVEIAWTTGRDACLLLILWAVIPSE